MTTALMAPAANSIPKLAARFYTPIKKTVLDVGDAFDHLGDVIQVTGFPIRIFCFRHPDHVGQILKHPEAGYQKFPKMLPRVRWTMRSGGYILEGNDDWRIRRKAVQKAFRREALVQYTNVVPQLTADMLDGWEAAARSGASIDVFRELRLLIVKACFRMFFSVDLTGSKLECVAEQTYFVDKNFLGLTPLWCPLPQVIRFRRCVNELRAEFRRIVEQRRTCGGAHEDLLTVLLEIPNPGSGQQLTTDQIVDEICSIFFGASVMSTSLAWCLYLASVHAGEQDRMAAESVHCFPGRLPSAADLADLTYVQQVLNETLRLYPPSWGYPRFTHMDVQIDDYRIPAKSMLIPMVYHTHRHPDFWQEPERFDPDRFAADDASTRHPFAHLPYGAGPRICLGAQLAPMIMTLVTAMVSNRYRLHFEPRSPDDPVADFGFEIHPREGLHMTISERG